MERIGEVHSLARPFEGERKQCGLFNGYTGKPGDCGQCGYDIDWRKAVATAQHPLGLEEHRDGNEQVTSPNTACACCLSSATVRRMTMLVSTARTTFRLRCDRGIHLIDG